MAFEVKGGERASPADARHMRGPKDLLDGPLLGGFVLHLGRAIEAWDHALYALPAAALLARAL
jgi:hypothetical protein